MEDQLEDLQQRIVIGAIDADPVQMHGASVAALELYPISEARSCRAGEIPHSG